MFGNIRRISHSLTCLFVLFVLVDPEFDICIPKNEYPYALGFSKLLVCEHIFVSVHMRVQEFVFSHIYNHVVAVKYVCVGVAENPRTITVWDLASSPRNKFRDLIFAILFSPPSLYYYYLAVPVGWPVNRMHIWYCCHSRNLLKKKTIEHTLNFEIFTI